MRGNKIKPFFRNTNVGSNPTQLYTWSPDTVIVKKKRKDDIIVEKCTATSGSQGVDPNVTYVYELLFLDGKQQKMAYVECGYVV